MTTFQQRLALYDGSLTTKYDANRTVTIMGAPNSEVMGMHVEDSRSGVSQHLVRAQPVGREHRSATAATCPT